MMPSTRKTLLRILPLTGLLALGAGCGDNGGPTGPTGSSTITLSFESLQPILGGVNYQAWVLAKNGGNYYGYPLVLFNLDEEGQLVDPASGDQIGNSFDADLAPEEVLGVGISLEISPVLVDYSSYTFIMGGMTAADGTATLTAADDSLGMGVDLSGAEGNYLLGTLTDTDPENDLGGIWFVDPSDGDYVAGLNLPEAPVGWDYEGWVEVDGVALSTGKFFLPSGADGANLYSGSVNGPLFPGEDFFTDPPSGIAFPVDLSGAKVFITLEPWQGWDAFPDDPFYLRLMEADIPENALPLTPYPLTSVVNQYLPSGTATVQ